MPTTEEILATIKRSNLVSSDVIDQLRKRLERSRREVDLRAAVKWLVGKEHITLAQAKRLLAAQSTAAADTRPQLVAPDADDELELAPLDDRGQLKPPSKAAEPEDDLELFADEPPPPSHRPPAPRTAAPSGNTARWAGTPKPTPSAKGPSPPQVPRTPSVAQPSRGPLDDLFGTAVLADPLMADAASTGPASGGRKKRKAADRSVWDSPLLLIGGGSLALLVIVGGVLLWRLGRETGDQALRAAEDHYKAGSYAQAINKFDHYLEEHPNHAGVSIARVHRGVARLRQTVEGTSDWPKTQATAKKIISQITTEPEFSEARAELAALLPRIAEGLAQQAADQKDRRLIELARETLAMVDKYVPKTLRPSQYVANVEASLALTARTLDRDVALEKTIERIREAASTGEAEAAYAARKELLKDFPDLVTSEALHEAVATVSDSQRSEVRWIEEAQPAETSEAPSPIEAELALAHRTGSAAPGLGGEVVCALASGAAYGLEARSGRVLWRRFVGFDTDYVPQAVSPDPDSDVILVDTLRDEVLRVASSTGDVRWRQTIGEPFEAHPVLLRDRLAVATRSGRLMLVDLASGNAAGYVQMPQGLRVGPAADPRGQLLYQLGEHSNLYVLSAAGDKCHEVLYLGHDAQSVRVPPLAVSRYVILAENSGATDSVLRVLLADENGLSVRQVQEIHLAGHVFAPLELSGRTLVVVTDRGAVYIFEVTAPGQGNPLTKVVEKPADEGAPKTRFAMFRGAQLWVAGTDLTRYEIQAAAGRLEPKWVRHQGDVFLQTARLVNEVVVHARQKSGFPGATVAAAKMSDGTVIWETHVGAPPAGEPISADSNGTLTVVSTAGALFDVPADQLAGHGVADATASIELEQPLPMRVRPARLQGGQLALAVGAGDSKLLIIGPPGNRTLQWLGLPDPLASPPLGFDQGLLIASQVGHVFVLDPQSAGDLVEPFQPRLEAGSVFTWSPPALLNDREVLIADGRSKLYRLGISDQSRPSHLVVLSEAELLEVVPVPPVAVGDTAYVVTASGLLSFSLPDLAAGSRRSLAGELAWGPERAGDYVLLATTAGKLMCLEGQDQVVWERPLPYGSLAGAPLAAENSFVLASMSGTVYRIDASTGEENGGIDLRQPLASGPLAWRGKLVVTGYDGTLLVLPSP